MLLLLLLSQEVNASSAQHLREARGGLLENLLENTTESNKRETVNKRAWLIVCLFTGSSWLCLLIIVSPTQIPLQVDIATNPELIHTLSQWRKFSCDLFNLYRFPERSWRVPNAWFLLVVGARFSDQNRTRAVDTFFFSFKKNFCFLRHHKQEGAGTGHILQDHSCQTIVAKL